MLSSVWLRAVGWAVRLSLHDRQDNYKFVMKGWVQGEFGLECDPLRVSAKQRAVETSRRDRGWGLRSRSNKSMKRTIERSWWGCYSRPLQE